MLARVLAWPILIGLNIATCLLLLLLILIGTDYGTQQLFATAQRWLPLQIGSVEGNALKDLRLKNLQYQDSNMQLQADEIFWSLNLQSLWLAERQLHIKNLHVQNFLLTLANNSSTSSNAQTEPFSPQDIKLPLGLQIDQLQLKNIRINQAGQHYNLDALTLNAKVDNNGNARAQLSLENGPFASNAQLQASASMTSQGLQATLNIAKANALFQQQAISASGQLGIHYHKALTLNAKAFTAQYGSISLNADGDMADSQLNFSLNAPDLSLATPELSGSLLLQGHVENNGQIDVATTLNDIRWLGAPQLTQATIHLHGTLAEQNLGAQLTLPAIGNQTAHVTSQFGWRDDLSSLLEAIQEPPEQLLKQTALHFQATLAITEANIVESGARLENNVIAIRLTETDSIAINGQSQSGQGQLTLNGVLQLIDSTKQTIGLEAEVNGQQYQLANTPELKLSASPALSINLQQQLLTVRGEITIDNGHIDIIVPEEGAIGVSQDIEIIDGNGAAETTSGAPLNRDIAIKLIIAEPISLQGQGFKGSATGQLNINEQTGAAARARGELTLAGQYKAYGQDLTIRRGKLVYVDSPIDNPGVDLEAIRTVGEQVAGVRVTGPAANPKIEIFAEPALSETEALAYLVLGRGLDTSDEQDQRQLSSLALSLGLAKGGNLLEKSKNKLGVDELSIQTGNSNSEASLLVGRQLSKRLYLSTQIGLFEPVAKLLLRYKLGRKCEAIAEAGLQQGIDLACSITTD